VSSELGTAINSPRATASGHRIHRLVGCTRRTRRTRTTKSAPLTHRGAAHPRLPWRAAQLGAAPGARTLVAVAAARGVLSSSRPGSGV